MDPRLRNRHERWFNAEYLPNAIACEHLGGGAGCDDPAMVQQHDLVGKAGGEIQVVNDPDRDDVGRVGKIAHPFS